MLLGSISSVGVVLVEQRSLSKDRVRQTGKEGGKERRCQRPTEEEECVDGNKRDGEEGLGGTVGRSFVFHDWGTEVEMTGFESVYLEKREKKINLI